MHHSFYGHIAISDLVFQSFTVVQTSEWLNIHVTSQDIKHAEQTILNTTVMSYCASWGLVENII